MKYTSILAIAGCEATLSEITASTTSRAIPAYFSGANIIESHTFMRSLMGRLNHYAVEVTNEAGAKTGQKVLYKDGAQKSCAVSYANVPLELRWSFSSPSKSLRPRWRLTWLNFSQEPGPNSTSTMPKI